jgi:hypothetical protein
MTGWKHSSSPATTPPPPSSPGYTEIYLHPTPRALRLREELDSVLGSEIEPSLVAGKIGQKSNVLGHLEFSRCGAEGDASTGVAGTDDSLSMGAAVYRYYEVGEHVLD